MKQKITTRSATKAAKRLAVFSSSTAPTKETFSHSGLNLAQQEFRLLRILPAPNDTSVDCGIGNEKLGNRPYTALPYAWGKDEPLSEQKWILLNERPYFVWRNLWSFLYAARQKSMNSK